MSEYPEHEKLKGVKPESQAIGGFLQWLAVQGLEICQWKEGNPYMGDRYTPVSKGTEAILAEYFEIDLDRLEAEKLAMMEEFRAATSHA